MFRGRYDHNIDDKGRTSFPAKFREVLTSRYDDRLIVTSHLTDPCLVAYPHAEWIAFEEKVRKAPSFEPAIVALKRLYIGSAIECSIDRQGRILLPQNLRDHARIAPTGGAMVWVGQVDTIELWAKECWDEVNQQAREKVKADEVRRTLADLGL